MKNNPTTKTNGSLLGRTFIGILFGIAALYIVVVHWHTVSGSLEATRSAHLSWLLIALGCMVITMLIAAVIYGVLALHRLRYRQTVLVEVAAGFVNRILPSGLGSLGLHGVYLYKRKHTVAEATAVVSVNNLLGVTAHLSLLLFLIVLRPHVFQALHFHVAVRSVICVLIVLSAVLLIAATAPVIRRRVVGFARNLVRSFKKVSILSAAKAWGLAVMLTSLYVLILWFSGHAVDVHLSMLQMFVVFTAGMFSGTIVPLPGGLVGMEAGLLVSLVAYDIPTARAGAVVVIFRFVTYWLPIIPGVIALFLARRKRLV